MCSVFTPGCRCETSNIDIFGNVYCPNTMCSDILHVNKKIFERSDFQCPQCSSVCQERNVAFEEQTNSFSFSLVKRVLFLKKQKKSIEDVIRDIYCPTRSNESCVHLSTSNNSCFYECKKCKACSHLPKIPSKDQKQTIFVWWWWYILVFKKNESQLWKKKKSTSIFGEVSPPITISHTQTWAKNSKSHSLYGISVSSPHCLIQLTKTSFAFSFYTLSVYSKARWVSVSNNGIEWYLDLRPDAFPLTVKDLVQDILEKFSRNFSGCLELVAVSMSRLSGQPSSSSSICPQPATDCVDEGQSALERRCARYGHKLVSVVWSGRFWILLRNWSIGWRRIL